MGEIIKVKNAAYARYEEALLRRDNLRKEATSYHYEYIRVFGHLITESFRLKVECIRKKKMITYCQKQVNMGKKISAGAMADFIEKEMADYQRELEDLIKGVKAAGEAEKISGLEARKIKDIYYKLVKLIHPDMHPELAEDAQVLREVAFLDREEVGKLEVLYPEYLKDEFWQLLDGGQLQYNAFRMRD